VDGARALQSGRAGVVIVFDGFTKMAALCLVEGCFFESYEERRCPQLGLGIRELPTRCRLSLISVHMIS
jgi:hypothetical protein